MGHMRNMIDPNSKENNPPEEKVERTVNDSRSKMKPIFLCGVAQKVVRWYVVRLARVRFPARHPHGDPSSEQQQ